MSVNRVDVLPRKLSLHTINNEDTLVVEKQTEKERYSPLHQFRQFTTEVSIVGLKYVTDQGALSVRRLVWLSFVLFGLGFATYQISTQCRYFLKYPTSVNIKINKNDTLTFPTVTICNENLFNRTRVEEFDPNIAKALRILYPPLADPSHPINFTQAFDLLKNHTYGDWGPIFVDLFVDTMAMQIRCLFSSQPCDPDILKTVITEAGRCLQINSEGKLTVGQPGAQSGLQLSLDAKQALYLAPLTPSAGFRVYIHRAGEPEMMFESAFKVNVNQHTQIQIAAQSIRQKPAPYGTCSDAYGYNNLRCVQDCLTAYQEEECGCGSIGIMGELFADNRSVCNPIDYFGCLVPRYQTFYYENLQLERCDCPSQCTMDLFPYTISSGETSDYFLEWAVEQWKEHNVTAGHIRKNFVLLDIFYSDLEQEVLETLPSYSLTSLLCDLGGALGLVLGSTVLTIFEIGDFLLVLLWQGANVEKRKAAQQK